MENRDANTNVRFHQADTLRSIFRRLADKGIYINRCRMDCGSFSQNIIKMVHGYCNKFYIRASRCESLYQNVMNITDWKTEEINFESYQVASIPFTSFLEEENYRLVIQRQKRKDGQSDLFEGEYTYRCIVTNDHDRHLPCSFLKENTVFLLLTSMARNFYDYLVKKVSKVFKEIEPQNRIKKFVFRFITVPAKWVKTGRR